MSIQHTLQNTPQILAENYLFPHQVRDLKDKLEEEVAKGKFYGATDFELFKLRFESVLVGVAKDSSFELTYQQSVMGYPEEQSASLNQNATASLSSELLPSGLALLTFNGDFTFSHAEDQIAEALQSFSANNKGLILDLRMVGEGSLELSQLIISFFTPPGSHIANVYFGQSKSVQALYSTELSTYKPMPAAMPLFIITSGMVQGPWEFLAYSLQQMGRATIVGWETMGVGQLNKAVWVSRHLKLSLPTELFS